MKLERRAPLRELRRGGRGQARNRAGAAVLEWTTRAPSGRFTVEIVPRPDDGDWTAAVLAAIERPGAPELLRAPFCARRMPGRY